MSSPSLSAFPLELLKLIATHLPLRSVLAFSQVSTRLHAAVFGDTYVFRSLFLSTYDPPSKSSSQDVIHTFISRHVFLRTLPHNDFASSDLPLLRSMLLEAHGPSSLNIRAITCALPPAFRDGSPTEATTDTRLQQALELLLLPARKLSRTHLSATRAAVYAPNQRSLRDTWKDLRLLNMIGLVFQHHLDADMRSNVFYQASMLDATEKPGWWEGRLGEAEDRHGLRERWFGAYVYRHYHFVAADGEASLQDTGDDFLSEIRLEWEGTTFTGKGKDFRAFEILHGVLGRPFEIEGIAGWRKMTFAKDYGPYQWFYIGLMLPGRNIVIGRWGMDHHITDEAVDGPSMGNFMWWTVPEAGLELGARDNRLSLRP